MTYEEEGAKLNGTSISKCNRSNTTDMDTKSRLAKVIANLPWRKNDEK